LSRINPKYLTVSDVGIGMLLSVIFRQIGIKIKIYTLKSVMICLNFTNV